MNRKIRTAAVIGSGVMGGGIAALLASAGIKTLLLDIVPPDLAPEKKTDRAAKNRIVKAGFDNMVKASPALLMHTKDAALVSIGNMEDDFGKIAGCDWIVEVVVENLRIKQDLFKRIDGVRRPGTIVSSNTSGIPLKAMSEGLSEDFRRHFLGTHFFNPVRYMHLLEIIPGADTLPEVLCFMADFGERSLGKGIVWAKDTPNFVGNRIGVYGMTKAMQLMVEDGLTIPEVDAIFGPAMGRPKTAMFKTSDLVGLDVMGHVARNTYDLVPGDEERAAFVLPEFVTRMVDKQLLGKKSGAGFYKTDITPEWKQIYQVINPATLEYEQYGKVAFPCLDAAKAAKTLPDKLKAILYADDRGARYAWKAVASQLIYSANRIPEIADTIVEIDNAMKGGFNFTLGPFETWDAIGVADSVAKMEKDGFNVPAKVKQMLAAGASTFYKTEGGKRYFWDFAGAAYKQVATSASAIDLALLKADGRTVTSNASASLIDIGDGVFCLEFHTKMNALNAEIIESIHEALAYVDQNGVGLVIGNQAGGMPGAFSAGADLVQVAMAVTAGGGCMNLWKRFVSSVPEAVGEMDLAPMFLPVFMNIAMAKVSTSAAEARANGFLGPNDRIVFNRDLLIGEAKKEVLKMEADGYAPPAKRPLKVFGESAQGMVHGELHNMQSGGFVSEYDVYLARRIAFVISGGEVRANSLIDEDVILTLERQAFVEFVQQEKTQARIEHMLKTGKPLRN